MTKRAIGRFKPPRQPLKPHKPKPPEEPKETCTVPAYYEQTIYGDNTLASIMEMFPDADPNQIEICIVEERWDDGPQTLVRCSKTKEIPNVYYKAELKKYKKELVKYEESKARYEVLLVEYNEQLKVYEEELKTYQDRYREEEIKSLERKLANLKGTVG